MGITDRELDLMAILWDRGSATAGELGTLLEDDLAHTTIITTLRTMERKGLVRHEEEGRAHRFFPVLDRDEAGVTALARLRQKIFSGSTERLLTYLVSRHDLSRPDLEELRDFLDELLAPGAILPEGDDE